MAFDGSYVGLVFPVNTIPYERFTVPLNAITL